MGALAPHRATWNAQQARHVPELLADHLPPGSIVWDPCAGIGVVFHDQMSRNGGWFTIGTEIEPEWAGWRPWQLEPEWLDPDGWPLGHLRQHVATFGTAIQPADRALGTFVANSTRIPERLAGFADGVVTSLVFDNRFADGYVGAADYQPGTRPCPRCKRNPALRPGCETCGGTGRVERGPRTKRFTTPAGEVERPDRHNYAAMLGRTPTQGSTAALRGTQWRFQTTHLLAAMCVAVREGGTVAVEIKDALEDGGRVWSLHWLLGAVQRMPLMIDQVHAMRVPGQRRGDNRDRVPYSQLVVMTRTRGML